MACFTNCMEQLITFESLFLRQQVENISRAGVRYALPTDPGHIPQRDPIFASQAVWEQSDGDYCVGFRSNGLSPKRLKRFTETRYNISANFLLSQSF